MPWLNVSTGYVRSGVGLFFKNVCRIMRNIKKLSYHTGIFLH